MYIIRYGFMWLRLLSPPFPILSLQNRGERGSVSNESNVLLNPEVLKDFATQALTLTVLATLVKHSTDEVEMKYLYQYLAEASEVFPRVFPVM